MSDGKNTDDETSLLFPNGESGGEQHRTSAAPYTDASKTSDAGEATVRFLPLDVPQPPAQGGGDAPVDGSGMQALTQAPRHGHKGLVIAAIALLLLVAAVVGGFFAARSYYSGKAAPGVSLGGQNVTGQDEAALTATVKNAFATSTVTVKDDSGKTLNAKLSDLGVTLDEKTTVANLLNAKSSEALAQVNPFSSASVPLTVHTDDAKMTDFLTGKLVDDEHQAHAATVEYDTASNSFVAKAGSDGRTPDIVNVKTAVNKLVSNPGDTSEAKVTYREVKSPISEQVAKEAANAANGRLANAIVIDNGEGKTFTIPSKEIAQWTSFSSDLSKGTISVTYNQDAMKAYLKEQLPSALNQDSVNEENVKNTQGTVLTVTTKGVNGISIKDTDATAQEVAKNLDAGQAATIKAQSDVTKYTTTSKVAQYDIPNGDLWIQVDRSKQNVTVYRGTTVVNTFNVVTGKNGDRESDPGTFFVNIKYETQDMRGADYLSKGVKWISYYNGGEGFHAAPWNVTGIAKGDPVNYGSHGCINMTPSDAQWIYENAPVGTMVKVIGAQPTAAVR
ncbi:L,D-transpeptidase family protein [Bifidobacterium crudilactis]|jgi:lipoprotein-anchoring transpeptidase ErfK/SrfK|uniref:L,D-transpeptidase family protein n=1 Tax=Bifidobacterium crudilactis TaxID=327277 RepID=UPI002357F011|nr:L,D-transpeptidase family protein [Bifidobacterium crudilactis]MCI1869168.1 L,D-transpeptidase/peptidoglycan binding protein [Bifidobacterium crudilactis]